MLTQALNPDPEDVSEDDDEEHMYEDAEDEGVYDIGGGGDAGDAGIILFLWIKVLIKCEGSFYFRNGECYESDVLKLNTGQLSV